MENNVGKYGRNRAILNSILQEKLKEEFDKVERVDFKKEDPNFTLTINVNGYEYENRVLKARISDLEKESARQPLKRDLHRIQYLRGSEWFTLMEDGVSNTYYPAESLEEARRVIRLLKTRAVVQNDAYRIVHVATNAVIE